MARSAVVLGGSGLVGSALLELLASDARYDRVAVLTRRPLSLTAPKLREVLVDFGKPESYRSALAVDDVFCALGTTIAKAGSREAFRRVDLEVPLEVAREAQTAGAQRFLLVSAVGADSKSAIFYNRTKGELELQLGAVGFPKGLRILHPSMLLGERKESRLGERMATFLMGAAGPLLQGGLARYRAISAVDVARALVAAAFGDEGPVQVYEGEALFALAKS
jgi:uncharacterized protein YbjT (DUF2867 family)